MAASDYVITGTGTFATYAELSAGVGPLETELPFINLKTSSGDERRIGEGIMVDDEIMRLVAIGTDTFTVARGCADTIPQPHLEDALIWFYEDNIGNDQVEHLGGEIVAVKILPQTPGGIRMAVENSPPNDLQFNWRLFRPYPPGNFTINAAPWFSHIALDGDPIDEMVFSWVHRDRLVQADQLVEHVAAGVGPEPGTTYRIRLYRADDDTLIRTFDAIEGTTLTYDRYTAVIDFDVPVNVEVDAYAILDSMRDGYSSWQSYRVDFSIKIVGLGWGFQWGFTYGV